MKKVLFSLLCAFSTISAFAGDDFKLSSGDASVVAVSDMVVNVEFDYSSCQIYDMGEEKFFDLKDYMEFKGEDWVRDYPGELKKAEDAFVEEFNGETKKATIQAGKTDADYTFVFRLTEFSYGKAVVIFKSHIAWGTGEVLVRDNKSGETVATFSFEKMNGAVAGGIAAMELRREECYEHVAEALAKALNKTKNKKKK